MKKRSYAWFEKHRRTKALELTQQQITKAFNIVNFPPPSSLKLGTWNKERSYSTHILPISNRKRD